MDNHAHTAIGKVIHELYGNSEEKSGQSIEGTVADTELREVKPSPNHVSLSDIDEIPKYIPNDFLEFQLTKNLIQSYRVEFGTKGNGDPTGYGYEILESDHATKHNNVFKLVVLYKNIHERNRLRSYVDTITTLAKHHKWFHEVMDFVHQRYIPSTEDELCYMTFDSYSADNAHYPRINYDPFDETLNKFAECSFYRITSFDEWRAQMLLEAHYMSTELHNNNKWVPWWTYDWKIKYVLRQLIGCITEHEEIEVTW